MDFNDTQQEAEFRAQARGWIDANAPHELLPILKNIGFAGTNIGDLDIIAASKAWQAKKFDAGWSCIHWPKAAGGREASAIESVIWQAEEGDYAKLSGIFVIGQGMAGPTIMRHGTDEQKARFLPPMSRGDHIWCQLFSEPGAGSDLAGLRTKAIKDGDDWVINGQKIWTSGAQHADFAILVTRTDPNVPKHKGLTFFLVDMKSPGIEVRPIKQVSGQSHFNEVFLTDVRIPDSMRLDDVGAGWKVAMTTLMNERFAIGGGMPTGFEDVLELAGRVNLDGAPALQDRAVRERLAEWYVKAAGLRNASSRTISQLSKGETPGPQSSMGKLVAGASMQDLAAFALDLMGPAGASAQSDPELAELSQKIQMNFFRSIGTRLEGGTDEILRNIIAERVLGLPQDPRLDKGVAFKDIPTGKS